MLKNRESIALSSLDDIFSTQEERSAREHVQMIRLQELHPFEGHPFSVRDDAEMESLVKSVKEYGVVTPLIVRPDPYGGYEVISGHRRLRASELAGVEEAPVIIRDMDDDDAIIFMVDANLQRENIPPCEKGLAYRMKLEAIKHQGRRRDLEKGHTSSQVGMKLQALDEIGKSVGESRNQIHRYIRLTELIPELQQKVDDKMLAFNPAVEISYLSKAEQQEFLEAMELSQSSPSLSQAQRLKKLSQSGSLDKDQLQEIMAEDKSFNSEKMRDGVTARGVKEKANEIRLATKEDGSPASIGDTEAFSWEMIRKYFPQNYTTKQMQETILRLLDQWQRKKNRDRER